MDKTTTELFSDLTNASSLKQFQQLNQQQLQTPEPLDYLQNLLQPKKIKLSQAFNMAQINDSYARHIRRGERPLNRDKILRLALAVHLTLEETQNLLKYAEEAALYARSSRDSVIIFALQNKHSLLETNETLHDLNMDLLVK